VPPIDDDLDDLADRSHDPVRGELCRLIIANKADLGIGRFADGDLIANVDDVARVVLARFLSDRERFAERFPWLVDAITRLQRGEPAVPLDG